jgi:hypothetical protein
MKLKKIMRIVCANVPKDTSPKELYRIFLEVVESLPETEEEVTDAIEETIDTPNPNPRMGEDEEEGLRQDPSYKGIAENREEDNEY